MEVPLRSRADPWQPQGWLANRCGTNRAHWTHCFSSHPWSLRVSFSPGSELHSFCIWKLSRLYLGSVQRLHPFLLRPSFVCEYSFGTSAWLEIRLSLLELCWHLVQFLLELGCSYLELCHSASGLIPLGSGCPYWNCAAIWPAGCLRITALL